MYDIYSLALYMQSQLRATADVLQWTDISVYEAPVKEAVSAYGVLDIALATDQRLLELYAQVEAWRAVANETAADTDYDEGGVPIKRSQIHKNAMEMLSRAELAVTRYSGVLRTTVPVPSLFVMGAAPANRYPLVSVRICDP